MNQEAASGAGRREPSAAPNTKAEDLVAAAATVASSVAVLYVSLMAKAYEKLVTLHFPRQAIRQIGSYTLYGHAHCHSQMHWRLLG